MVATVLHALSIGAALCGFISQIRAGKTRDWEKQNIATMAWIAAYVLLALSLWL